MSKISDERREVAERLRFCARETNGTSDFSMYLGHWVNADDADEEQVGNPFTVQADRKSAERTLEKLADLIDPTCEVMEVPDNDEFMVRVVSGFVCKRCGHEAIVERNCDGSAEPSRFCPHCGARVTSGGER